MQRNAPKRSNNIGFKVVIGILLTMLASSLVYIYKLNEESKNTLSVVTNEKEALIKDLEITKQSLETTMESNTSMTEELMAEKEKIQQLMVELEKTKSTDTKALARYKGEIEKLKSKIANLIKQIEGLKKENATLTTKIDSTNTVLKKSRFINDTLVSKNNMLAKAIEKGSKLSIVNLQTTAVKQKSSGRQIVTDKASRANVLKISFTIAENQIAKSGDKSYYIQIIDSKNNVLGDKKIESFGDKMLTYSFVSSVRYENKTVKVEKDLPVEDISEGTFFVNVFDKTELVAKTSFSLR
ncbi:hypothetical protein B0A78_00225 [Flavobacterium columnare NBRC 100251 = ATCC 23463]|uniref:Chromosome segregation protein SMC n=2 Tax=Flavobacterium columnare TaxID=996 RepID=G8X5D6_FLACA|nr:hypothetical protein [Flavobacterium columnare]AEW86168.1 hypothetical protein FCOL_06735 [Flavobacterium columnare ATCC 49512]AMO19885.1 hypothetical protein UN65_05555 [Flavobacterium columnare]MBF6651995.1 hypothetical protein [Flavobacterium columnare]MBF6654401.1 hypothetical protein [Flavobacterium columnare]MBF6657029.1 hypothetical protein [Flavobacterium columnare]